MRKIYLLVFAITSVIGCQVENINYSTPIMSTNGPENVMGTSAQLGGAIVSDGGKNIIEHGIVYSMDDNPDVNDTKIQINNGTKVFSDYYNIFEPSKTYYYRSYGINEEGIGYGALYGFTTTDEIACSYEEDNYFDFYWAEHDMNLDLTAQETGVDYEDLLSFGSGNLQFYTVAQSGGGLQYGIMVQFLEINKEFPKSGTYTTIDEFNSAGPYSDNKVRVIYNPWGVNTHGNTIASDQIIYVENENGKVTITFCDVQLDSNIINGKFTYQP